MPAWVIFVLTTVAAGAFGAIQTRRVRKMRGRAEIAEKSLDASQADIRRANATLRQMADNMEKLRNEKTRIAKSDLDSLIDYARELSDDSDSSPDRPGGISGPGAGAISGNIVDG